MFETLVFLIGISTSAFAEDPKTELIPLSSIDYSIKQDIRYATDKNFTKKVLYAEPICVLRRHVAEALARVQSVAKLQGFGLKVYDCYRPASVQKVMWSLVPDERYVADPAKGSKHNRGAAVDVTLVDGSGNELTMPSEYDDFSEKAHRNYAKGSSVAKKNRARLEKLMVAEGFIPMPTEWWHFDFRGWEKYPIEDLPLTDFKR